MATDQQLPSTVTPAASFVLPSEATDAPVSPAADEVIEHLNEPWWTPQAMMQGLSSGLVSLVVHLLLFILLAFIAIGSTQDTGLSTLLVEAEHEP